MSKKYEDRRDAKLVSPKTLIELVLDRKIRGKTFSFYDTVSQKVAFWTAFASIVVGVILGGAAYLTRSHLLVTAALGSLTAI